MTPSETAPRGGWLRRFIAGEWARWSQWQFRLTAWAARRSGAIVLVVGLLLLVASLAVVEPLQGAFAPHVSEASSLATLQQVLLGFGTALVGATVITFSFVMFALQVNVERMPHGLFQRLSADGKLLGAFLATFLLATGVLAASLAVDIRWIGTLLLAAIWATLLILLLLLYAYRRALSLINPAQQLALVVKAARADLRKWARRARRAAPLLETTRDAVVEGASNHDVPRVLFFKVNPAWTSRAKQAVTYAMTLAHGYSDRGDHEVADIALNAVVAINAAYVEAKGRSFFAANPLFDNPFTTDGFINETLEHLRKTARIAIRRGDERQIEQTFYALAALTNVYLRIDYASERAQKTHAHIAAGYLAEAVKAVAPHDMPDVLMEGATLIGSVAAQSLAHEQVLEITEAVDTLGQLAAIAIVKPGHAAVTQTAVAQLADLMLVLLRLRVYEAVQVGKRVEGTMSGLAKVYLQVPDSPLENIVGRNLAPYYSILNRQSVPARLVDLVNAIGKAEEEDADAQTLMGNIEQWADGLSISFREMLEIAIQKKSHFMADLVNAIERYAELLLALSAAPSCDDRVREELRGHALRLVQVFSWVPDQAESIRFSETYEITEKLFTLSREAERRGCEELAQEIRRALLTWAMKWSRHDTGWAIPERALPALAAHAVSAKDDAEAQRLLRQVEEALGKPGALPPERRARLAHELRTTGHKYRDPRHARSNLEHAVATADPRCLVDLLEKMAELLERT